MFLKNYWYIAALPSEIVNEPLGRVVLGEPVVLFRMPNGKVVALEDRCCHRHLPLSMGKVVGATIQCGYHGLRFDKTGSCIEVPGQKHIPPGASIHSYPAVERYSCVWIWMGSEQIFFGGMTLTG